jgi:hypothetical protein
MRVNTIVLATALCCVTGAAGAQDHLVTSQTAQARLVEAAAVRAGDQATLGRILASSDARQAASWLGVEIRDVRAAVASLSDSEVRELAERARSLRVDPAAGLSSDVDHLLVIFLIVAIVILVLQAVH